jgi:hypothetical protein
MTALVAALTVTSGFSGGYSLPNFRRPPQPTPTATWQRVEEPLRSAAASTDEPDSPQVTISLTWIRPVVERLTYLSNLQRGWGGPETFAVDRGVILRTLETLVSIAGEKMRPPSISPGPDGSLQLAWYVREFDLEIDVPLSGDPTAALYEHASGEETELPLTSPKLRTAIGRLTMD